jgi:hypothetical protein
MPIYTPLLLPPQSNTYHGVSSPYLTFTKNDGNVGVVTPDGCNCIAGYTIPVPNVVDPNTGEVGYGCRLTTFGETDLLNGSLSVIYDFYLSKATGKLDCYNNQPYTYTRS